MCTKIDYTNLEALELGGKVGIDGCKVSRRPQEVTALAGPESHHPDGGDPAGRQERARPAPPSYMAFPIGPDNPDFVPYDQISPHLINSIMTTEDNGFFKHRGWVTPEFKTALRRNLPGGGFRLGASSITMQMVKNVLLSREKTLSRKLQELFLVWYIEQLLPKERILELYFNAIEFGPRLYGIGAGRPPLLRQARPETHARWRRRSSRRSCPAPSGATSSTATGSCTRPGTSTSGGSWRGPTSAAG